jgi:WD40 repeat protein
VIQHPARGLGSSSFFSATLSRDGNWFASLVEWEAGQRKQRAFKVWDVRTGKETRCLEDVGGWRGYPVVRARFAPDGRRLATIALPLSDKQLPAAVQLWDVVTGQLLWTYAQAEGSLGGLAFSPDGRKLATLSKKEHMVFEFTTLVLLDTSTGRELKTIPTGPLMGHAVVFAPTGNWLAVATKDSAVQLVNLDTGETVHSLIGHKQFVQDLSFNPDGKRLASASCDYTIKIWDTATGQETLTLRGHKNFVNSVCFSADGHRLLSCDDSGVIRAWDATPLPQPGQ